MAAPGMVAAPSTPASMAAQWMAASTPSPSFIVLISNSWISFIMDNFYPQCGIESARLWMIAIARFRMQLRDGCAAGDFIRSMAPPLIALPGISPRRTGRKTPASKFSPISSVAE
ncbi:hypothetical protein MES4922_80088 [Mesorhizobium ventifaucium]|uniref:Uncharacterized protein n=1 Tax=Mesorhizobium ventifaucium TaxID=666020 RepID=A0ABN8KBX4_9HYPH|nr:hypothetical protein MES4922_80088 [Mesorhizobium ventifaucium]